MSENRCPDSKDPAKEEKETLTEACCELHPPQRCGPAKCLDCGKLGKPVQRITLGALVKPEKRPAIPAGKKFCFCRAETCDVVYFLPEKVLFRKTDLLVRVGLKEPKDPTVAVCYCFGWTPEKIRAEIRATGKSTVISQIKAQIKAGNCYCEVTNPQGSCCLGNVSQAIRSEVKPHLEVGET